MYLTRMFLNTRRRSAMRLLDSPQRMHAAVASSFPPESMAEEAARVLWRIDQRPDKTSLIVTSPVEPDMSALVEQAGWQTGELWQTRPYGQFLESIDAEQNWLFRLVANPTYSGRRQGWDDTKPRGHTTVKQQEDWLLSRAERLGFVVPDGPSGATGMTVSERRTMHFARSGRQVTVVTAAFEGVLSVTNPDLLRHALVSGIGRAKAYGCGLMTLMPQGRDGG